MKGRLLKRPICTLSGNGGTGRSKKTSLECGKEYGLGMERSGFPYYKHIS